MTARLPTQTLAPLPATPSSRAAPSTASSSHSSVPSVTPLSTAAPPTPVSCPPHRAAPLAVPARAVGGMAASASPPSDARLRPSLSMPQTQMQPHSPPYPCPSPGPAGIRHHFHHHAGSHQSLAKPALHPIPHAPASVSSDGFAAIKAAVPQRPHRLPPIAAQGHQPLHAPQAPSLSQPQAPHASSQMPPTAAASLPPQAETAAAVFEAHPPIPHIPVSKQVSFVLRFPDGFKHAIKTSDSQPVRSLAGAIRDRLKPAHHAVLSLLVHSLITDAAEACDAKPGPTSQCASNNSSAETLCNAAGGLAAAQPVLAQSKLATRRLRLDGADGEITIRQARLEGQVVVVCADEVELSITGRGQKQGSLHAPGSRPRLA
ncbi:hypothetical protein HK105_200499 [Polyrhizophydium stewartii]|uniref:Uncharacterized protein n=1 Tax=Polyrhizophydium stewartii TaxID=2732419 RepID=A0ABR4NJ91_9FUNG